MTISLVGDFGCANEEQPSIEQCDTDVAPADADWDPVALDWSDPGEPGDPAKSSPYDDITPHHEYLTAVHAIHMPTGEDGELLMFHGKSEQRRWPIGGPASAMEWLPIPVEVEWGAPAPNDVETYPDIFCSGHVRLGDGRLFFAGGNINNAPEWGGLTHAFIFDPERADPVYDPMSNDPVFGWDYVGEMAVDRWYPTLTLLGDGRVLISGGDIVNCCGTELVAQRDQAASSSVRSC